MVTKSESAVDNPEFLLEATKFDDSNLEKDVEESVALMCRKNRWRQKYQKPKGVAGAPTGYVCEWNWPWKKTVFHWWKLRWRCVPIQPENQNNFRRFEWNEDQNQILSKRFQFERPSVPRELVQQIESHPNSCQHPLINYLVCASTCQIKIPSKLINLVHNSL